MKYFIYQGNDHDCGFAALKMYLAHLANDKSYLYIPKPKKREYYSVDDLVNVAESYGVKLEAYTCTKDYADNLEAPLLALIDENHVVFIKKKTKRYFLIYDPGRGILKMSYEEFARRWRDVVILASELETASKIPRRRRYLLSPKLEILNSAVALVSAGLLIAAFYLLNKRENFIFSLVFLILFVITQIAEKALLYKQVYTFDNEYIPRYFKNKVNCTKEKYEQFVDYKRRFFVNNRQVISAVLIAFCITFLLCFNDFRNIFALLALILLKLLEIIVFSKSEQEQKNVIAGLENDAFISPEGMVEPALKANLKADAHIFYRSIKDLFYIFVSFIFAVAMMFITNNMGCNFVIFHFVMYYAGFSSYNQLLDTLSLRKENKRMEARFFDSCNL